MASPFLVGRSSGVCLAFLLGEQPTKVSVPRLIAPKAFASESDGRRALLLLDQTPSLSAAIWPTLYGLQIGKCEEFHLAPLRYTTTQNELARIARAKNRAITAKLAPLKIQTDSLLP